MRKRYVHVEGDDNISGSSTATRTFNVFYHEVKTIRIRHWMMAKVLALSLPLLMLYSVRFDHVSEQALGVKPDVINPAEQSNQKIDAIDFHDYTNHNPFVFLTGHTSPFPYFESTQVLHPDLYAALEQDFPPVPLAVIEERNKVGNKSIRRTDKAYEELLARSPAWRALDSFVYSQKMIDFGMQLFGPALQSNAQCKVDPKKAVFVDRNETLSTRDPITGTYTGGGIETKPYYERRRNKIGNPNELYVVMDFFHGPGNITGREALPYTFNRHLDWPFRVFSILLYFSETDESTGGNLDIYNGTEIHQSVNISRNGGVAHFSPHPDAWHGVRTFTEKDEYRKLIQIQVSSSWSVCRNE